MQQTGKVSIWIKSVFMNLLSISGKSGLFGVVVVDDVGLLLLVVLFVFRGGFFCLFSFCLFVVGLCFVLFCVCMGGC